MKRPEFAGRPGNFSGTFFQKGKTGITTTEGKHWARQRAFLVQHLQTLTSSKGFEEVPGSFFRLLTSLPPGDPGRVQ